MARISRLLVDLTIELADAPLARSSAAGDGPVECDTVDLELRLFREAFGPLIPMLLERLGLARLETRGDLNNLALALQWLT